MRTTKALALVVAMLFPNCAQAAPFWMRSWTVTAVRDNRSDVFDRRVARTVVTITPETFADPLSATCPHAPDYSDLQLRPVSGLGAHFGRFWKFPKTPQIVTYGWVRCDGSNLAPLILVDGNLAYHLYEEGTVLEMR